MSETRICANCGAEYPIDEMFQVENAVEDDTHTLCDHCFDEYYVRCEDRNRIIHRDRAYWDGDDNAYCASCWDEHCEVIHEYNYTPDLVFHGKGLRHFGVELEIDDGGMVNSNAKSCSTSLTLAPKTCISKTDGSLDDGMELVTHPMTLEYHLNENALGRCTSQRHSAWVI